ncbi:PQQ-binding-like beta-propeller repeat protein [Crassaminicella indica]|uniref:PQQ-binding-like beta-propeller repeat protein n=1 Tax=Crassaminicella indica TaxID=2855394 RepID=A0ABX8R896_9CLOT|nr:PQQ-binding-like beta-propeller repeat protein [Crassaminicella indica]QXM05254.1 PQQ-binding-like beta-propeller repeat protein [Crassaminicella indica]
MINKRKKLCIYIIMFCMLFSISIPTSFAIEGKPTVTIDWERHLNSGSYGKLRYDEIPAVHKNGNIYVNNENGYLFAIAPDRTVAWKVNIFQKGRADSKGGAGPVFDKKGIAYIASADKNIYAITADGNILWTFKMDAVVAPGTSCALGKAGTIYSVSENGKLYAINKENGEKKWDIELYISGSCNTPVVSPKDGTIFVGSNCYINAITNDGKIKWHKKFEDRCLYEYSYETGDSMEKRMAVGEDGTLYFMTYALENHIQNKSKNRIHAFNGETGKEKWHKDIYQYVTAPAVDKNVVYYKTQDNRLHALNKEGNEIWVYKAENELYLHKPQLYRRPVAIGYDGTIYVPMGKNLYAINPDGSKKWSSTGGTTMLYTASKPSFRGEIYCVGENGRLVKFTEHNIKRKPNRVEIHQKVFALTKNCTYRINVNLLDTYGCPMDTSRLNWTSSDEKIVQVDQNGNVKTIKKGVAKITATVSDNKQISDTVTIHVVESADSILKVDPKVFDLEEGRGTVIATKILTKDGIEILGEELEWISKTLPIVKVSQTGNVVAVKEGRGEIRVRIKNYPKEEQIIHVNVKRVPIKKVGQEEIKKALNSTIGYYARKGINKDWEAFGMNAAGEDICQYKINGQTYIQKLKNKIKNEGIEDKMTDYERITLGILAAGEDPTKFEGINFIEKIYNWPDLGQGMNAAIWGLIALDAANAEIPLDAKHTRESFIKYILSNMSGEGWSWGGGDTADVDMTGMALCALAPYKDRLDVKVAGNRAIKWLSKNQSEDGRFGTWGNYTSESCSQAIMGLTAWGIDPQGPEFTKRYGNAVTGLLSYHCQDGMFIHIDTKDPSFATPQGLQALAALLDFSKNKCSTIFYKINANKGEAKAITAIEIMPDGIEIEEGQRIQLRVKDQIGREIENKKICWESSDETIAMVDKNGLIQGIKAGKVNICASLKEDKEVKDTSKCTIVGKIFEIKNVQIEDVGNGKNISFSIRNITKDDQSVVAIVGLYDKNTNRLIQQEYVEKVFDPQESYDIKTFFSIPTEGEYMLKLMIWNDWFKGRPLIDAVTE